MAARTGDGWPGLTGTPKLPDLPNLIKSYRRCLDQGLLEAYRKKRWTRFHEFSGWLVQENIPNLDMGQAASLFRASGGRRATEFKTNPVEEIRDTLDFLLYDEVKLEGRFDECAAEGGGFKLAGAGKEFISYILCLRELALFGVWNSRAERVLRREGDLNASAKTGPMGIRYLDILEGLAKLRHRLGLPDYIAVDEVCYSGTRIKADG